MTGHARNLTKDLQAFEQIHSASASSFNFFQLPQEHYHHQLHQSYIPSTKFWHSCLLPVHLCQKVWSTIIVIIIMLISS